MVQNCWNICNGSQFEQHVHQPFGKRAMETHPDRGGSKEIFQRVTVSYKALMLKLKNDRESHEHNELRESSSDFLQQQTHENKRNNKINAYREVQ